MTDDETPPQDAPPPPGVTSPEAALSALQSGNARFLSGQASRPGPGADERLTQLQGQSPFAAVLACSDSRVPVELVLGQGFGDLFVIRVAGNVVGSSVLGSVEYAIRHLGVRLLLVLGHEQCGAVRTALLPPEQLSGEPDHLLELIGRVRPALAGISDIREAVLANVRHQVAALRDNPLVEAAERRGQIQVTGAYYEIGSGAVTFLTGEDEPRISPA